MLYDLNSNNFKCIDDVQSNLDYIYHKTKTFSIKDNSTILPCKLTKSGHKYYKLKFNGTNMNNVYLIPFLVIFADYQTSQLNNNCYFENIHKTPEYSGTTIMTTVLKMLKIIGIKKVYLIDSAKTDTVDNLSLRIILSKGYSYYQRFGFQFTIYPSFFNRLKYENNNNLLQRKIRHVIKKLRKTEHKLIKSLLLLTDMEQYNSRVKYLIKNHSLFKELNGYLDDSLMCLYLF